MNSATASAVLGGGAYMQIPWKPIYAQSVLSTVFYGNNTYVFSVDKHREYYIFAFNTSEPILICNRPDYYQHTIFTKKDFITPHYRKQPINMEALQGVWVAGKEGTHYARWQRKQNVRWEHTDIGSHNLLKGITGLRKHIRVGRIHKHTLMLCKVHVGSALGTTKVSHPLRFKNCWWLYQKVRNQISSLDQLLKKF